MYKKIYSKFICLGFTWGIFSWIDFFKNAEIPSFINSAPVFLSIGIGKLLLKKNAFLYDKNIFIFTILLGGLIGYFISSLFAIIISVFQED